MNPSLGSATLSSEWLNFREEYRKLLAVVLATLENTHEARVEMQQLRFRKSLLELLLTSPSHSLAPEYLKLPILQRQMKLTETLYKTQAEQSDILTEIDRLREELGQEEVRWAERFPGIDPRALLDIDPVHCVLNFDLCGSTPAMTAIHRAGGLSGVEQFKARFFGEIRARLHTLSLDGRCRIDDEEGDGATLIFAALDDLVTFVADYSRWVRGKNAEVNDPSSPHTRWYRFGACSSPVRYTGPDATSQAFSPANRLQAKSAPGTILIDDTTYSGFVFEGSRARFTRVAESVTGKQTDGQSIRAWYWVVDPAAAPEAVGAARWFHDPDKCAVPRDALRLSAE